MILLALLLSACGTDGEPDSAECGDVPSECLMMCPADLNLSACAYEPYPPSGECLEVCAAGSCCSCAETEGGGHEWATTYIDCSRPSPPSCPNNIASDENCGNCTKNWGAGASYCADRCETDDDCIDAENPWASSNLTLVCHPSGYCTRPCSTDRECTLSMSDSYTCDPSGACSFCVDCF